MRTSLIPCEKVNTWIHENPTTVKVLKIAGVILTGILLTLVPLTLPLGIEIAVGLGAASVITGIATLILFVCSCGKPQKQPEGLKSQPALPAQTMAQTSPQHVIGQNPPSPPIQDLRTLTENPPLLFSLPLHLHRPFPAISSSSCCSCSDHRPSTRASSDNA